MPHHEDDFGACQFASEFHAAENVWVGHVAGHSAIENVAEAKVHNHFGRCARINTTEQGRRWILPRSTRFLFIEVIAVLPHASAKTLIPFLHYFYDFTWAHFIALRFGERVCVSRFRYQPTAKNTNGSCRSHSLKKTSTCQMIAVQKMLMSFAHEPFHLSSTAKHNNSPHNRNSAHRWCKPNRIFERELCRVPQRWRRFSGQKRPLKRVRVKSGFPSNSGHQNWLVLRSVQQPRQLGDIRRNPSRLSQR